MYNADILYLHLCLPGVTGPDLDFSKLRPVRSFPVQLRKDSVEEIMVDEFQQKANSFIECGNWKKCFVVILIVGIILYLYRTENLIDAIANTTIVKRVKNILLLRNDTLATNESLASSSVGKNDSALDKRNLTLDDIFISVKSSKKFHETRMKILMETWIQTALNQTYIFTDEDDNNLTAQVPVGHVVNTKCGSSHSRKDLCCKFAKEYDHYMKMGKSWFCHVDDDNYLNVGKLLTMLRRYNASKLWYLGRASHPRPISPPRMKNVKIWFATFGAGLCFSRALAKKIMRLAGNGRFNRVCNRIHLPDDCTLGYIINYLLKVNLTRVNQFHSHLEKLNEIKDPENQITVGFHDKDVITIEGFDFKDDPTRLKSLHCKLHPEVKYCSAIKQNKTISLSHEMGIFNNSQNFTLMQE